MSSSSKGDPSHWAGTQHLHNSWSHCLLSLVDICSVLVLGLGFQNQSSSGPSIRYEKLRGSNELQRWLQRGVCPSSGPEFMRVQ